MFKWLYYVKLMEWNVHRLLVCVIYLGSCCLKTVETQKQPFSAISSATIEGFYKCVHKRLIRLSQKRGKMLPLCLPAHCKDSVDTGAIHKIHRA